MEKSINNKKSNIINFSKTFFDCYTKAQEYYQIEAYDDALLEANNALSFEYNSDVLLLLAEIYMEKENYDMVMNCASQVLALGNLDNEKKERLFMLIPKALSEVGQTFASFFYILKNSSDIANTLSKIVPVDESLESFLDNEMRNLLEDNKNENDDYLLTSNQVREKYNEETISRAMDLMMREEFTDAKYLLKSLYETESKSYTDGVRLLSYIYAEEGNSDEACKVLYNEFQKDKTNAELISNVYDMGEAYRSVVIEMLNDFIPSDDVESMYSAIGIANKCGYDDYALQLAERLVSDYPWDIKSNIIQIIAKWNCENSAETKKELIKLLYTCKAYYPVKYIEKLRFPTRFDLSFVEIPNELISKLNRSVLRALNEYEEGEDYQDLLNAIIFLMRNVSKENYANVDRMLGFIEDIGGQFLLDTYQRITSTSYIHPEIQKYAICRLVDEYRMGSFFYNNEGFIMKINICVPPSYDDFRESLQGEYCSAFALLAEYDNKFEKQLSGLFEKIYLKDIIKHFPEKGRLSMVTEFYLIAKNAPESLKQFCQSAKINFVKFQKYAIKLKELLEEE